MLHNTIHIALTFSLIIGTATALVWAVCSSLLLRIIGRPEKVYTHVMQYLRIYLVGILLTAINNVGAGILRAIYGSKLRCVI